jgi:signal transduction histidine kinase
LLSKWPIRNKLVTGIGLLLVMVLTLSWSAFYGLYAYRGLVKSLERVEELRLASDFNQKVSDLRVTVSKISVSTPYELEFSPDPGSSYRLRTAREEFQQHLAAVKQALAAYKAKLQRHDYPKNQIADSQRERETVREIEEALARINRLHQDADWMLDFNLSQLTGALDHLHDLSGELPGYLHRNIHDFTDDVRNNRRTYITLAWTSTVLALVMMALLVRLFYKWVFRPLRVLIKGSRKVAAGDFGYRIRLDTRDEMSELAEALNDMTDRFQTIRDDLDRQVQLRTRQAIRSEKLASVGFLAAGVAHEINNPLASIAMCAESLEGRTSSLVDEGHPEGAVVRSYLRMIQDEAFRCKEITGKLLDFSRMGETARQNTELRDLVQGVIDMVGHLGKYQSKQIEFAPGEAVVAAVNAQEIKQVVLNLLTNALESTEAEGRVRVELKQQAGQAVLVVADNGCGMTEEVLEHLFEPFFTRRRHGQGTGLGLSITYRIIEEHGGQIEAASDGPGRGSRFCIRLPIAAEAAGSRRALTESSQKEISHRHQAA